MKEIVTVERLAMKYQTKTREVEAIADLGFSVCEKEFVSIVGPSGCGKSTLLSLIAGLLAPSEGQITVSGRKVNGPMKNIGYMLQKDHLFEWRTILQNVLLGPEIRGKVSGEIRQDARRLLEKYGLGEFSDHYPGELSGGMRQRCALIRTLMVRPDLLLLDEAFSGLDSQTRLAVSQDIYSIIKEEGMTALMVTHDIYEALSLSDRILVLSGRPARLIANHPVPFASRGISPMKRRELPEFNELFEQIWKELEIHV